MGRPPCCEKVGLKKGSWTPEEDQKLISYIQEHGHGSWRALPAKAGLRRCGKSCRLRWTNYLRPDIKRGKFSSHEEHTIIQLHALLGNRWSAIATHLPKRTDNEIKNYWNTHLKKRLSKMGIDPVTHRPISYGLGSATGGLQSKEAANLSHMAQWESARLEAEARFVSKKGPHPITHSLQTASAPTSRSVGGGVKAWQGVLSEDHPFNSSQKLLPTALSDRSRVEVRVGDQKYWREEGRLQRDGAAADNVPEFIKDHEEMPFPDINYSEEDNANIVLSCVSFDVDAFSEHLFPDNSSLSFAEEDSDIGNSNYVHGSGAPAAAFASTSTSASGFEENGHFWNNIVSLLDYSSAF